MENLTKGELIQIAALLRGRREEIAKRAGVSKWTVDSTFQNKYPNAKVLEVAAEMIEEQKAAAKANPLVEQLRSLVSS